MSQPWSVVTTCNHGFMFVTHLLPHQAYTWSPRRRLHDNAGKWKQKDFVFVKQPFGASTQLRKREVNKGGVGNDYWTHVNLTREAWVTIIGSMWKASSTAILSSETTWLLAENTRRVRFWVFTRGKRSVFEVFVFKVSTLVSVFGSLRFACRFHRFGVNGKPKPREISSFLPNSIVVQTGP